MVAEIDYGLHSCISTDSLEGKNAYLFKQILGRHDSFDMELFHVGKIIRKMTLPPQKNMPVTPLHILEHPVVYYSYFNKPIAIVSYKIGCYPQIHQIAYCTDIIIACIPTGACTAL